MAMIVALVAFAVSALLTGYLHRAPLSQYMLDRPSDRSLHGRPIPRSGGIAIAGGVVCGGAVVGWISGVFVPLPWFGFSLLTVASVAAMDDIHRLPVAYRLMAQILAAALLVPDFTPGSLVLPGVEWQWPEWVAAAVVVLFAVWMINLYNFMDGIDGLAAGMAVVGFGAYSLFGWLGGYQTFALLNMAIATAAAGFLVFNFPPARIFMGDLGSSLLGLLAVVMALRGMHDGVFPAWVAALVFLPFIADATVTLIRRMLRGEKFWHAHKTHFYQRLVQSGWGHKKTVLLEYAVMLGCALTALGVAHAPVTVQWLALGFWAAAFAGFFGMIAWLETARRHITTAGSQALSQERGRNVGDI